MISVILPVYNGEKYIYKTIRSILNQTISDFELLIVNDCSTDETVSIINNFNDKRIKLVNNSENLGIVKSLNKAIELSNGEFIARIDADDICEINRFELQYKYISSHNVDLVGTSYIEIDERDNELQTIILPETNNEIKSTLLLKNCIAHPSIMIKTKVLKENYYSEMYENAEDYELWVRIMDEIEFYNIPLPLLRYRVHNNGITVKANRNIDGRIAVLSNIYKKKFKTNEMNFSFNLDVFTRVINCLGEYRKSDLKFLNIFETYLDLLDIDCDLVLIKKIAGFSWLRYTKGRVINLKSLKYYVYGLRYYKEVKYEIKKRISEK